MKKGKEQQSWEREHLENFEVSLTPSKNLYPCVYNPGESLTGTVEITNVKPIQFKAISVKCHIWCGVSPRKNGKSWVAEEQYLNSTVTVADKGTLERGPHSFPFNFLIPATAPTTYSGPYGSTDCEIQAIIDTPLILKVRKTSFLILKPLNLNDLPNIQDINSSFVTKDFTYMLVKKGTIILKATSDLRGYSHGQAIILETEIENRSEKSTSTVVARFMQKVTYQTKTPIHVKSAIAVIKGTGVNANKQARWKEKIIVPALPQSRLQSCRLINIEYYIQVSLKSPEVSLTLPIFIGDVRVDTTNPTPPQPVPEVPQSPPPSTRNTTPTPTSRSPSRPLCGCFASPSTPLVGPEADVLQAEEILTESHSQPQDGSASPHSFYRIAFFQTFVATGHFCTL
ncbi:hypothetical protein ACEWY4_012027 [Coilia grayii]|uniref:Arrestin C-terminal-like domain-containing protein n=1 Tax=Coilia grayii TaxID=363190 RepID=A0ABD1JZB5_9TELE